jgi:hypothetical protein
MDPNLVGPKTSVEDSEGFFSGPDPTFQPVSDLDTV